jgi:hypothetical protein
LDAILYAQGSSNIIYVELEDKNVGLFFKLLTSKKIPIRTHVQLKKNNFGRLIEATYNMPFPQLESTLSTYKFF